VRDAVRREEEYPLLRFSRGKEEDCLPQGLGLILVRGNDQEGINLPREEADEEPRAPPLQG
jgi:hypothetical protein